MKISLYDCSNAIAPNGIDYKYIWCKKGYKLGTGAYKLEVLDTDKPLVCESCQDCPDQDLYPRAGPR